MLNEGREESREGWDSVRHFHNRPPYEYQGRDNIHSDDIKVQESSRDLIHGNGIWKC